MGYFGSILLTRADTLAAQLPNVDAIGHRHVHLRELGGGWQVLETNGWNDPPHLVDALAAVAAVWDAPVLAAYVNDGDCAQLHWATPGRTVSSVHLPAPHVLGCSYFHRPEFDTTREAGEVEADLVEWASWAGLTVARPRLARAVAYSYDGEAESALYMSTDTQVFELIRSLGFPEIPAPRPYVIDPTDDPFAQVAANMFGLAYRARSLTAYREHFPDVEPKAGWEDEALQLERDIYASAYGGHLPYADLAARAIWVREARKAAKEGTEPPPREIMVDGMLVTNMIRVTEDLADNMINNQVKYRHAFGDFHAGTGIWPELA